ncbi:nuclease [Thalictrum thalictroides]|uniref:Nuclease n=1 Tax=Thalictrum thalictroides TaxID=46969 RepID=A0A7J6W3S1_THATH|nr:nuclease [Thalictrum thalictroides]
MRFTYVLTGWEGSAHDGRLLRCAVSRPGHRLTIPANKYYLADAGFALVPGFLTPYRQARYHLREIGTQVAQNATELYNFRHSSLRTVVERCIGVLKERFAYLRNAPYHSIRVQSKIILACVALHNFLKDVDPDDDFDPDEPDPLLPEADDGEDDPEPDHGGRAIDMVASHNWTNWRDQLRDQMWDNFENFQYKTDEEEEEDEL